MPLNVCYKNVKHLGVVFGTYPENWNIFMVAITDLKAQDLEIDMNYIKNSLAGLFRCTKMFGKIDEIKFSNLLENKINDEHPNFKGTDINDFLKFLLLKNARAMGDSNISKVFKGGIDDYRITGRIILDISNVQIKDGVIILDKEVDYIYDEKLPGERPIYGRIVDYPVISIDSMGVGEGLLLGANLSDFGGRNHTHATKIKIESGNFINEFEFPVSIYCKKGMNIQLYVTEGKINRVLCDGLIYEF